MKFVVTERIPTFQTFIYEVEAESQTDALEMVLSRKAIESEMVIDEPDFSLAEYKIEDEDERYMVGAE